jgi:diguanylate cyclase (GGDEF)-like protein/PAS domain S-box-containing protein
MPPGSGNRRCYLLNRYPVRTEDGRLLGAAAIRVDVTELRAAQAELERALASEREARALLKAIVDHSPFAIVFCDRDLRYRLVNREAADSRGLPAEEIVGRTPEEVYPELAPQIVPAMRRVLETGEPIVNEELSAELPPGSGRVRHYLLSRYPVQTEEGEILGVASMRVEVTQLKELEERLQDLLRREQRAREQVERAASTDPLTGLLNRPAFSARLGEALSRARASGRAVGLLFLDLDCFKAVNDRYGHNTGDALLRAVGARLRRAAREGDLVARVGGDEFLLLVPDLDPETAADTAEAVAARARRCFADPFELLGREVRVRASVGLALFPAQAEDAESLLVLADQAMYRVKRRRRSQVA